jgi:DnaJ-class molecular chaperone
MIDFGGGMIFPDRYLRDQPDGPDPCDECEGEGTVLTGTVAEHAAGKAKIEPCPGCDGRGYR